MYQCVNVSEFPQLSSHLVHPSCSWHTLGILEGYNLCYRLSRLFSFQFPSSRVMVYTKVYTLLRSVRFWEIYFSLKLQERGWGTFQLKPCSFGP